MRVSFYLAFPGGGIGKYSHSLLDALQDQDDLSLELVCQPDFFWRAEARYPVWPRMFRISDDRPMIRRARFLLSQWLNPHRFLSRARATRAEVLHLGNVHHLSFGSWSRALDRTGAKLVYSAHDVRRRKAIVSRGVEERNLAAFYRRCDALFVHSDRQGAELAEFGGVDPARIHVVPMGPTEYAAIDDSVVARLRAGWGYARDASIGLFFGFVRPEKRLPVLLRALAKLPERYVLVVAGQGNLEEARALVDDLGLQARVRFDARYVPDSDVSGIFQAVDWVALPYDDAFTSQSSVLNLAVDQRRPVVATPTPAFRESLSEFSIGELAHDFSAEALGDAIARLRDEALGPEAFAEYAAQNSWQRNASITCSVYRRLLGESQ